MSAEEAASSSHLPGYGQIIVESQIQTDDDSLRDRIHTLYPGEVLVLRGDRDNSLSSRGGQDLNEGLIKQHLSCLVVPHTDFHANSQIQTKYLKRYLALYVLFKTNQNLFTIHDDVVKAFYIWGMSHLISLKTVCKSATDFLLYFFTNLT